MSQFAISTEETPPPKPVSGDSMGIVLVAAIVLGPAFLATDCNWRMSTLENYQVVADQAAETVASGNVARKAGYLAIGFFGLLLALRPGQRPERSWSHFATWVVIYLFWCILSILWSVDPEQSVKRLAVLGLCLVGVWGLSKHLSPRQLARVTLTVALAVVVTSLAIEFELGTFHPFRRAYRFAGFVHPNTQGAFCALLCLSAFFVAHRGGSHWALRWAPLLIGVTMLVLTKSLTAVGGLLFAAAGVWLLTTTRRRRVLLAVGLPLLTYALLLAALIGGGAAIGAADSILQSRRADAEVVGLNGRIPLWMYLLNDISARPFLGYGYDAFWNPTRIGDVSDDLQWTVPNAHSAYVESLLNVGVIGAAILAVVLLLGLRRCAQTATETQDNGDRFVFALLLFAFVSGFCESSFCQPVNFPAFIAASGLVAMASCLRAATNVSNREATSKAARGTTVTYDCVSPRAALGRSTASE